MATLKKNFLATNLLAFTLSLSFAATVVFETTLPVHAANQQAALLNNDGVKALNAGNFTLAIQKFEEALKIEPGYSFAKENLAIAYNNYALKLPPAQAIRYFHRALAVSPTNPTTAQNLDAVVQSLGKNPKSFKDRVELGKQCRNGSPPDFDGAIVEFQAALKLQNDSKLHVELGNILRVQNRIDDAINEYKAAIQGGGLEQTEMAKVNVDLGQAYQAKKDLKSAITAFGEAIKYKSDDPDVLDALVTGWEAALAENPQAPENHIGLGQAYQYKGDFGMAEAEYKQALSFDRNNSIARQLLSQLGAAKAKAEIAKHINNGVDLQTNKNYDGAIAEYMIALRSDPNNPDIFVNIGSACQAKNDYDHAIAAYNKALQLQPGNKPAQIGLKAAQDARSDKQLSDLTARAADLYKSGKYQEALTAYQQLLAQTPKDAGVHFNVAAALQQLGQIDQAIVEYKQAVALDPKNADYQKYLETALDKKAQPIIDKAVAAHKAKKYQEAVDLYQQAISIRPNNTDLYFDVASALYSLQLYDQARTNYTKALQLDPKNQVNDLWLLGTIDEHYGKGYDAMDKYRKYIAAAPGGTFAKAAKERLDALSKNPNDTQKIKSEDELARIKDASDAYTQAVKLQQDKQYDAAMPLYQKAISLQPKESAYPYALGTLYFAKGDLNSAADWIEKALALDPQNKDYLKYKDYVAAQRAEKLANDAVAKQTAEDFKGAIALYQQALQLAPKNAQLWTNVGSAYYSSDDFTNALDAFKKALAIDEKSSKVNWYSVAAIDEHYGRGPQALEEYRKFVAENPGDKLGPIATDRIKALTDNPRATKQLPTHSEQKAFASAQDAYDQGVKLQQSNQLDQALALYQKAHDLNPKESAYIFAIGSIYQGKNDLGNAATWYQQAVQLSPNNAEFKKYLEAVKVGQAGPLVDEAAKKYTAGDFAGAVDLYRKALAIVPNDPAIHTDLASCLQASDDFQNALNEYEAAYKSDPKSQAEVQYFIGALKEHFNRGTEALANYREYLAKNPSGKFKSYAQDRVNVLAKNPNNVQHLQTKAERESSAELQTAFDSAVKLQQDGKFQDADAQYASLMQKNPREAAYPYARGTNYQQQGDLVNAIAMYDKAAQIDATQADYKKALQGAKDLYAAQLVQKAGEKFTAKDFPGAVEGYKQALSYASKAAQANIHTNMGIALQYSDQFAAARDEYNKGYQLDPKGEVENLYFMGPLDETLGRGQQAFDDYKNYLAYNPKGKYAKEANDRYQILYYDKNKLQKMQTSAETANLQKGNDTFNEAVQLQQDGKLDEAIAKYLDALKITPNADSIWYSMGTAYQAKNDMDKAIEAYGKAAAINPKEPTYKKVLNDAKGAKAAPMLEDAYKKQTATPPDYPGAIAAYEAALKLNNDATTHLNLGTAYQANKQIPQAEREYMQAVQMDPKLFDAYYYLGTIYESQGKKMPAAMQYQKYLAGASTGQYAADAKNRLKTLK